MDLTDPQFNRLAEIAITILSLLYLGLIVAGKRAGWWFGIAASLLSAWLFIRLNLLAESALYGFYVFAGLYGFFHWKYGGAPGREPPITTRSIPFHAALLAAGTAGTLILARALEALGSSLAHADAATTVFSLLATWMVARKILENWIYWILIDALSVWLYASRGAPVYAGLMALYSIFAAAGFVVWLRRFRKQASDGL